MSSMKCVRFYPPGGPEKLRYESTETPSDFKQGELLIKVHATSVIAPELTWPIYQDKSGSYYSHIPCHDFSGTVAQTALGVDIAIGAEVMAFTSTFNGGARKYEGAAAEYAIADIDSVVLKPNNVSLLEAATVPLSALTAWQALHVQAQLQRGQRLLITGAAGATGIWAVQFAKMIGAYVIGTASSEWSFQTLKDLGIDEIIDYKKQKLTDVVSDIDLVLDTVGENSLGHPEKILNKSGQIVSIVEYEIQKRLKDLDAKFFIVSMNREQLKQICDLIEAGKLKTFVDSVWPLNETAAAFQKGADGRAHGKIVVKVES